MKTPAPPDELDLNLLFFRLRRRWRLFAGALLLAGAGAWLYLQVTPPQYAFRATMLLGDQATGSKRAQDLLQMLEVPDKGLRMEDELGLIASASTLRQAVRGLPYAVEYDLEPAAWLNRLPLLPPLVRREQDAAAMPFAVLPALGTPQLAGVRVYVTPAGPGRYRLQADARRGRLVRLPTGAVLREVPTPHLDLTLRANDTLRHPLLRLVLRPRPGGAWAAGEAGTAGGAGTTGGRYSFVLRDLPTATDAYAGGLAVRPIDHDARIVELRLKSPVPAHAAQLLDTLMAVYVAANLGGQNATGRKTLAFLDGEIATLEAARQRAAGALAGFRTRQGVVDVSAQASAGIQRLNELQAARAQAATRQRYCQATLAYLRANGGAAQVASPSSAGLDDGALNNLVAQLADLNGRRAALGVNGSDDNPLLVVLDERIRAAKLALRQTLANTGRAAAIGLRDLDAQLAQVRGQIGRMPEDERTFALLKGTSDFNEKNHAFLVERRNEAALALATNSTDKRVVDPAQASGGGPDAPNPRLVALLALLAGLLLPAGLAVALDKANRTVQGHDDLARLTALPTLGAVAHGTRADAADARGRPAATGPVAESFRTVRVNLQYLVAGPGRKVLGVTSAVPGEGKTFCALHLAAELAAAGHRVALVEADLRRPTLAGYFGRAPGGPHGLASYLGGQSTLAQAIGPGPVPGLDLLLCGTPPDLPTQLLENPRMAALLAHLRAAYDYVVLDTPPLVFVAEYFVLVRHLDATVYVLRHNYTDHRLVARINALSEAGQVGEVYTLINDVRFGRSYEYRHQQKAYSYYK